MKSDVLGCLGNTAAAIALQDGILGRLKFACGIPLLREVSLMLNVTRFRTISVTH
ncbi:hypothetical protein H6F59_06500 [Nodosilinea sp. FACHB-141]|uniref:hypothetical protein n=1 Tax=Nodosilinea sp. FACHB-141 TaxID=2692833 RepID=UPI0016826AB2|nr:hypothetical protein [Nodosilinea sp. FACHB-141]MBD2111477.1 hypothetical protein [Nodosilinea sp. FACHB-141]